MSIVAAFAVPHPPLIMPAVGGGREHGIQATVDAYAEVARRIAALNPDVIIISSPHTEMYADYLHFAPGDGARGTFARFGAPGTGCRVTYDRELVEHIGGLARAEGLPAGTRGERDPDLDWGVLIPVCLIEQTYRKRTGASAPKRGLPELPCPIVRLGISGLTPADHYHLGQVIARATDELGRRAVYVASGDLSHKLAADGPYGFSPDGPVFDERVCEAFASGDFLALLTLDPGLCERAAECGLRSFQIMAGALDRTPVQAELLSHEGPFGVGYGVAAFTPTDTAGSDETRAFGEAYERWHAADMARRRAEESPWVALARFALETYVREERTVDPAHNLPEDLAAALPDELRHSRAGAFVSLHVAGELRGCIGTIAPVRATLADEICANAVSAGCRDPRFPAVTPDELDELIYNVDVLTAPEPVAGPEELDPARYGVIVSCRGRRGLLLPALDGVDTVDEQLRIAAHKGGIDLADPDVTLERFSVTRHY